MEYADGGTLADWFEKQPGHENGLPLETLLPIFRPLAEALDLAHRNGILHRDVKPQNIMFMGREKTPVLIDFGIAARIRPENVTSNTQSFSRTDTMAHSSSGTPRYMAPEQMEGKSQNSRTDQYALAMVLYEMLNGSLPFSGSAVSIVLQKSRFDPQSPQFAPYVNAAFARALSFNAADRFASCTDFMAVLSNASFSDLKDAVDPQFQLPDVDAMAEKIYWETQQKKKDNEKRREEKIARIAKEKAKREAERQLAREQKVRKREEKRRQKEYLKVQKKAERLARTRLRKEQRQDSPSFKIFTRRNLLFLCGLCAIAAAVLLVWWMIGK